MNQCISKQADPRIVCDIITFYNVQVKAVDSDVVILCLNVSDVAMSNGI